MVSVGDRTYGPTPAQVELTGELAGEGSSLHFVFERSGYRDAAVDVTVDPVAAARGTIDVDARLVRVARPSTHAAEPGAADVRVEGYRDSPY